MTWIDHKKAYNMVPQSWILGCLKMYKITNQILQFIEKTIQTWRVKFIAGGKCLEQVRTQRGIFQRDAKPPLLFVIAMMPLNHILRKCTAGFKINKSLEKINHLRYIDGIKLFAENEKELETRIQTVRILSRYRNRGARGYRRRKWLRRREFKSWPRLIAFHIALIPLRKV